MRRQGLECENKSLPHPEKLFLFINYVTSNQKPPERTDSYVLQHLSYSHSIYGYWESLFANTQHNPTHTHSTKILEHARGLKEQAVCQHVLVAGT